MQLAQSYLQGQGSIFDGVLEAYGMGQKYRQNRNVLAAEEAEQARKIAAQQALETIDWNDMNAIAQTVAQFPEYTKGAKDYYDSLEQKEQQSLILDMSKSISALGSDRPDIAVQSMRDKAAAYNDIGMADKAEEYSMMAEWMATDPLSARRALMMQYAVLSPEKSGSNLESYGKALNPQRKEVDAGDAIYSYSMTPDGEVGGAEWIVDKAATPDNVLDNETSIANNVLDNQTSRANNYDTNTVSRQNNITTNQTSRDNNITTNQQSNINSERAALIQQYGIDERSKNVDKQIEYNLQKQELARKEAKLQTFGGKVYMVYKDGTAAPALDAQGNQMTDTKIDPTIQRDIRNEKVRISKLNNILPEAERLLQGATGSRTGAAIDSITGAFGYTTEGRKTTAQLEVLAGQLVSMMPRMEGPQSDKDVAMYKAMAGNIADPTKTVAERQAALKTIKRMTQKAEADLARSEKQAGQPSGASSNDAKRNSLFK